MRSVMSKIFSGEIDSEVHSDFVKFSRGVFQNRYLIDCKRRAGGWSIKTSAEFANFFVRECLIKAKGSVKVKGIIVCTFDIAKDAGFEISKIKKYQGIQQAVIDTETEVSKILGLMEKHPRAFYALSFKAGDCELKVKAKPPKSGKPGKKGNEEPKADFCSLKTSDESLIRDLFFDVPEFKEVKIKHTIEIKEIEIPSGVSDPIEIREKAKKKGMATRFVIADGQREESEKSFVA